MLKLQYFDHLRQRAHLLGKTLIARKDRMQKKGATE